MSDGIHGHLRDLHLDIDQWCERNSVQAVYGDYGCQICTKLLRRQADIEQALADIIVWLEVEADHPREDPRPAMRLQAKMAKFALGIGPDPLGKFMLPPEFVLPHE